MTEKPESRIVQPEDREWQIAVFEHEKSSRAMDMGKIGVWFGSRDNAAVYLAAAVIFFVTIVAGVISIFEPTVRADMVKALIAVALSASGFMFGAGTQRKGN